MPSDDPSRTSITMRERLRADPRDPAARSEFVARSEPKIVEWFRGWWLQESDAQDGTQDSTPVEGSPATRATPRKRPAA
jgi:hypothetical protein